MSGSQIDIAISMKTYLKSRLLEQCFWHRPGIIWACIVLSQCFWVYDSVLRSQTVFLGMENSRSVLCTSVHDRIKTLLLHVRCWIHTSSHHSTAETQPQLLYLIAGFYQQNHCELEYGTTKGGPAPALSFKISKPKCFPFLSYINQNTLIIM